MLKVLLFDKQVCFHFGTENGEEQIKNTQYLVLCFISENIRGTTKRLSFKEVLWLIRLRMVSHLEMQTCHKIHHARWELPPLRWMMSFLPPCPCPLPSSLMINILGWQMRLCGVIRTILNILRVYFIYIKIWSVSACMWCLYHFTIKGPNTDNFLCSLSRKMPSFHPKLINFWWSQLEVFIGPRSYHSLPMSVTHWLTDSRPSWRLNELT